jgi:hypothetical protein
MDDTFSVVLSLVLAAVLLVAFWRMFQKAGQPGWASLIPIYNAYILLKIVGRPGWWLLLYFIPIVNLVISIVVMLDLAKSFGKGAGFGIGLFFLSFIFVPILAFGSSQYVGPAGRPSMSGAGVPRTV